MIVSTTHKKLVLNLRNPQRITTVIPTARTFDYKGKTLVAVPHKHDEVRVLRNLGFNAPAPIAYHYDWPGAFKPFHAQRATASFLSMNERGFCLSDMGTGKTLASLWAWDHLRAAGRSRKLLIVSPLSTLERTWADEIFMHFSHLSWAVLHGTRDKRVKLLNSDVDIFIINHDGIKVIQDELIARKDIDAVIIDEIATFRNPSSQMFKSLKKICAGRRVVWGLTGTPTPNEPTDAWAQCNIVVPERVPKFMGAFRDMTMKKQGMYDWIVRPGATEIVAQAMQPSIRFSRDQCVDLPPCMNITRKVDMTTEQKAAYRSMLSQLYAEMASGEIMAVNEAVKLSKLVQIACGAVYDTKRQAHYLPSSTRIDELLKIIGEAASKVIVYVPYRAVIDHVEKEISKHYTCKTITGATSKGERDTILTRFQKESEPHVLVAQPDTISHGLTLTAASTIVWYAPITSPETYHQANARITRPGQKLAQLVVHIEGSPVEKRMYARLLKKLSLQGILLDEIQDGTYV